VSHIYLMKDGNDLVSHCKCDMAYITFPSQMDCPWCGCGWLFTCINCRKAFTFAKGVEVKDSWIDLARRDITNRGLQTPDDDAVEEWIAAMRELLADVKVGKQYVCLDGLFIPVDATMVEFKGWHSKHSFSYIHTPGCGHSRSNDN